MTTVFKASDWLNGQLSSVMQLDSREALRMEYHVCTIYVLCMSGYDDNAYLN